MLKQVVYAYTKPFYLLTALCKDRSCTQYKILHTQCKVFLHSGKPTYSQTVQSVKHLNIQPSFNHTLRYANQHFSVPWSMQIMYPSIRLNRTPTYTSAAFCWTVQHIGKYICISSMVRDIWKPLHHHPFNNTSAYLKKSPHFFRYISKVKCAERRTLSVQVIYILAFDILFIWGRISLCRHTPTPVNMYPLSILLCTQIHKAFSSSNTCNASLGKTMDIYHHTWNLLQPWREFQVLRISFII